MSARGSRRRRTTPARPCPGRRGRSDASRPRRSAVPRAGLARARAAAGAAPWRGSLESPRGRVVTPPLVVGQRVGRRAAPRASRTSRPARASSIAVIAPAQRAPITMTSYELMSVLDLPEADRPARAFSSPRQRARSGAVRSFVRLAATQSRPNVCAAVRTASRGGLCMLCTRKAGRGRRPARSTRRGGVAGRVGARAVMRSAS
jgi:hypothetical protein